MQGERKIQMDERIEERQKEGQKNDLDGGKGDVVNA